ncbi:hypothetical protein [Kaistella montana]|uniref:DUF2281 domain-containing protein n=1 Tax=Kaistella montana TaxID=1849733 RepID=A0ABW5K7J7_9FLAO|nr:hypothetical protein [Kaistella montana]MCQ4034719.1 hypothetical protein [Kaistella montana]
MKNFSNFDKNKGLKMEITIKDLENNLKTLPKELLGNVNDYIDFLKEKYTKIKEEKIYNLSENQKNILDNQEDIEDSEYQDNEEFLAELRKEYGL